jgi:hypothetical protein
LSDALDLDFVFAFDLDFDREGHGFSRAAKLSIKSTRLQPLRGRPHRRKWCQSRLSTCPH